MKRSPDESPHLTLRRAAMDFLARREHAYHELLSKLEEKFPEFDRATQIEPALERLRDENLQSDVRFAESYVRHRRNRGHGPLKIRLELQHKGVAGALIDEQLYDESHDWRALAREALERKHPGADLRAPADYQRCYRFLAQRGFDSEDISAVLRDLKKSTRDS